MLVFSRTTGTKQIEIRRWLRDAYGREAYLLEFVEEKRHAGPAGGSRRRTGTPWFGGRGKAERRLPEQW